MPRCRGPRRTSAEAECRRCRTHMVAPCLGRHRSAVIPACVSMSFFSWQWPTPPWIPHCSGRRRHGAARDSLGKRNHDQSHGKNASHSKSNGQNGNRTGRWWRVAAAALSRGHGVGPAPGVGVVAAAAVTGRRRRVSCRRLRRLHRQRTWSSPPLACHRRRGCSRCRTCSRRRRRGCRRRSIVAPCAGTCRVLFCPRARP